MSLSESPQMSLSGFPLKGSEYLLQVQMTQLQLFLLRFHRQALLSASPLSSVNDSVSDSASAEDSLGTLPTVSLSLSLLCFSESSWVPLVSVSSCCLSTLGFNRQKFSSPVSAAASRQELHA